MFSSQESDTDCFSQPGHSQGFLVGHALQRAAIQSPTKTKKRSRLFTTVCGNKGMEGNMDYSDGIENEVPSHFNVMFSQDSNMCSQMSEDFSHRFKTFNVKSSQDDYSNLGDDTRSMMSSDGFCLHQQHLNGRGHMAPYSVMKSRTGNNSSAGIASSSKKNNNHIPMAGQNGEEKQKQITIAPPIDNPFIPHPHHHSQQQQPRKPPAPTSLWIAPYKERPRYVTDFEHVKDIGMGTFSSIFLARRRLDGMLYAIKRIVKTIMSDKEGKLVIREACAHAALVGCPHMIQYFGCWLDDGHLHIQTEYCNLGSLEIFTKKSIPTTNTHVMTAHSLALAQTDDMQFSHNPSSHSQMDSQLTDSQDPDTDPHYHQSEEDSTMMHGDNDDLESEGYLDDRDELAQSEVQPPRKLLRLQTSENNKNSLFDSITAPTDATAQGLGLGLTAQGQGLGGTQGPATALAFNDTLAWLVLARIGEALQYMHSRGMVHLDLRPANIFLTHTQGQGLGQGLGQGQPAGTPTDIPSGLVEGSVVMKLGDLGHTVVYQAPISPSGARDAEGGQGLKASEQGPEEWTEGESRYCARELIVHNNDFASGSNHLDLRAADMFSLGATVYELCLGRELGSGGSGSSSSSSSSSSSHVNFGDRGVDDGLVEWHAVRDGHFDESQFVSKYSLELVKVVRELMDVNPMKRPTAAALTLMAQSQLALLRQPQ